MLTSASRYIFSLLLILMLFAGASTANAGLFCSGAPFNGVVDGNERAEVGGSYTGTVADPFPTQITIDTDCTFQNFPASDPLTATLNFQTNDPSVYLITFNNVIFTGNMACANIDHRIWFVNGSDYGTKNNCQDLFIPVEAINKQNPPGTTTIGIGEPFTYTLNIPVLYDPATQTFLNNFGSANDLHSITITDDLNATGVDLSLVGTPTVTWLNGPNAGTPVPVTFSNAGGVLTFEINPAANPGVIIPAGDQLQIAITVVLNDTPVNAPGTQFFNTATWEFGRLINIDLDGDGIPEPNFFEPLPGENGVTEPLTIGAPDLTVTKTNPDTAINVGSITNFTIDVQNTGSTDAWDVTILDLLPDTADVGMCDFDPTATVTAQVFSADGVTPVSGVLTQGVDYTVNYTGAATCELSLTTQSSNAVIGPTERLIITYQSQLDLDTVPAGDGIDLINVAGATQWYSADDVPGVTRVVFNRTLTDGTPGVTDFQDNHTITAALSGYLFQKTVENITSGASPATTAVPGDRLRYRLRLFNFTEVINDLTITDILNPAYFDLTENTSFVMVTPLPNGVADYSYDPVTGELQISGDGGPLNLDPDTNPQLEIVFEINLRTDLTNGTDVINQASAVAGAFTSSSDDPYVNGVYDPGDPLDTPDPTVVTIQTPDALTKVNPVQTTYTIGDQFTYRITVPTTPVDVPLYDVRIEDDLSASNADMSFVSANVVSGGSWVLSNTGTSTSLVIEDTASGIDIPAGGQAVIDITVELSNTLTNQEGITFNNTASYTYNRSNGDVATQTAGGGDTTGDMTVLEPNISSITKTANNTTPIPGDVVRYTVTLTASGGANNSDVFDVTLTDMLDLGLVYQGNPTVTVGAGVSADNVIGAPDIVGDGVTTAQTLTWGLGSTESSDIDIVAGTVVTIEYDVQVLGSVLANQTLNNSVVAEWTSNDGITSGERDGSDASGGLNDYITAAATETLTTPDINASITKNRTQDTFGAGDADVRIGDLVEYELRLSVPEGTLGNLQLVDTLPQGLAYAGIVSINGNIGPEPYVAVPPFNHADITAASVTVTGDATTGPTTVTWSLGNVTNQPIDGASNDFVIVYQARVLNNVFAHTDLTIPLNNVVNMSYDTATGTVTQTDNDTIINALQPMLTVAKSSDPVDGSVIAAGNTVTYTVDIQNSGTAPAYDTILQDIIPDGMRAGGITMASTYLVSSGPSPGLANLAPAYNAATGVATWNFDDGIYTIPPGDTLRIVYRVQADAAISAGLILTNAAQVLNYYSFDDEVPPASGDSADLRETYGPSNTATTTLYTGVAAPTKVLNPVISEATIGAEVVYHITVPGSVATTNLYDVDITDTLHAGLTYLSATDVSGNGFAITDNTVGNNVSLNISQIPAGQQAVIELRTRVANNASANAGTVVTNVTSYTYAFSAGGVTQPDVSSTVTGVNDTFTIVEPLVTIGKAVANLSNPGNPPTAGDVLRYTVSLPAVASASNSDAFDVSLIDSLSLGLAYQSGTASIDGAGNTITEPTISGDGITTPQVLTWSLADTNADIDIVEGTTVTVTYDVVVLNTVQAGQSLTNSATAQWTSLEGIDANERNGTNSPPVNDYFTGPAVATITTADTIAIAKTRLNDTYNGADTNVRVGDIVEYELRMTLQEGTTPNVVVTDTLPQGLMFEEIVSINGDTSAPYSAVAPFTHNDITPGIAGDPTTSPTTLTLDIGDITNAGDNNPANDEFVITYRARILNDVLAQAASMTLTNNASLTFTLSGVPVTRLASNSITLQQPFLSVSKSAAPANGDTILDAGEIVTYTVDITNSGTAPAYDVVLEDTIPTGLRNGAATITMISSDLVSVAGYVPLAPNYNAGTGLATWDFDTGVANAYTIPAGDTLRVVYQVQADADLSPGLTLTNSALVQLYYSFDDEAVPSLGTINGVRQVYGPTAAASVALTTAGPVALDKQNTQATATVGAPFTYRILVPATPQPTALHDVRILDDLTASAADLEFVSVTAVGGPYTWTPDNTGTLTNLVIEDTSGGIDIPAGGQIEIEMTVVLTDSQTNVSGLLFNNTATYTYNVVDGDPVSQSNGIGDTTADMTIVGPDSMTLEKSGPATIRIGVPGSFRLNVHNTGTATAYDATITDLIPNPVPGGMCDAAPANITAQLYLADGVTTVGGPLVPNTDFSVNLVSGTPTCTLTFTMLTAAAAIPADYRLIIDYDLSLDTDSVNNVTLTNIAGVTEWFSSDTAGSGASGEVRTYTRTITDGTVGTLDHEDAYSVLTESPVVLFQKYVTNVTTGQDPGTNASPGDTLRYRIVATNVSPVAVTGFSITDEVDNLNSPAVFVPGSLTIISAPPGAITTNTDPNGGVNGTGLLDVRNLNLDAQGGANDTLVIEFEATLAPVINSGTLVLNQAQLQIANLAPLSSDDPNVNGIDDPNVNGDEDPTQTLIASTPYFQVYKTSEDLTGLPTVLLPGETLHYTITVKNVGNEDAVNVILQDTIPTYTSYVANSTLLNGLPVPDAGANSPLEVGMLIYAPEDPTPGAMRADPDPAANNMATIEFDVMINADTIDGAVISNQGFVNGDGAGGIAFPVKPSDDPATPTLDDPTLDVVSRPNGVIYDSVSRQPLAGATVTIMRGGAPLPASCFDDPAQQNQVTTADGNYKFDLNFSQAECPPGADYLIAVTAAPTGYRSAESLLISPTSNAATAAYSVPLCPADAVPATTDRCEAQASDTPPTDAAATMYYLNLTLNNPAPDDSQIFNNHIPVDPQIDTVLTITKSTPLVSVTRGQMVPYTITVKNTLGGVLQNMQVIDQLPPGFKYVEGSSSLDGSPFEPVVTGSGRVLQWGNLDFAYNVTHTINLLLVVGSGVSEGEYVNQAWAHNTVTGDNTETAAATVRVVPDPTFDCTDIIGKVFDDRNLNGYQDEGEGGLAGVRIATARGLLVTTDKYGRFHVTCAAVPDEQRGSNFILKLDERSLPSGYRVTTENPRVQRVTRGKLARFNFGATVHHVVSLSVADGVFHPDSTEIRPQWLPRLGLLIEELRKQPSRLRLTYLADVESASLVDDRIAKLKDRIQEHWKEISDSELTIETEIFWRHGGPVEKNSELSDNLNLLGFTSGVLDNSKVGADTEKQLPHGYTLTPWMQDLAQFKTDAPKTETEQVTEKKYTTQKLTSVVPPIPFSSGKAEIPDEFINKLRNVMESMRDRVNVRLHFIGHTDNVQLSDELQKQYVDNFGLSKERAGTTAEFFQRALGLPPEAISYEGMGQTKPIASNQTESGRARNRRVEVEVWYDEVSEELVDREVEVDQEIKRIMVCRVETMCKLRYKQGHSRRTKLKNLVPPFHYDEGVSEVPAQFLQQFRQALRNLDGKDNVQMRFIGYTDNMPLGDRDARIYGDHTGLSKANARRVATAVQEALGLPNRAVASTGKGSDFPLASNNSAKGRALNRRVEVEFWHDDPLEDLPDEPQICPEAAAAETVERIYNPPEGDIQPIYFENGQPVIPEGYTKHLQRAMTDLNDKGNVRLRFIGYTGNKRLDRRTAMVYGDDIGLSTARARRAMEAIKAQMNLSDKQAEYEGHGYVQSHDVVNTGFIELDQSKVEVQVVYDELAILDENEGVSIKRITRDVETQNPYALNLMRIVVDGQPINDPNKGTSDVQRCTDVALDKAQVNFKFDNLQVKPRLNVTAWPNVISFTDSGDTEFIENQTHFKLYTNYPAFISKAEVRLFSAEQSTRDTPIAIVPLSETGDAQWQVDLDRYSSPRTEIKYVLRVYDKQGNFDETKEQTLWIVDELEADNSKRDPQKELLVGYGENRLGVNNIPLNGGVVSVYGKDVPEDHNVWFAGHALPVADSGEFGGEYILPSGLHTVEVAITDDAGHGNVYQRDLDLEKRDWFYVGIADLTVARDRTNGPAKEVTGDDQHYNNDLAVDGRLAFYAKGEFENESVLTASADTREGPVDELFSNFMNKSPEALFRRLDPDYYYPTFGDDSTVEEDAPTSGKFYLKWKKDKNYGLWGNFDIAYLDNDLAHVDRGLYGANFNYEGDATTSFGEKRFVANVFAAEPGTVAGRDEFLGTGGSLYYLRRQDILTGSDRLHIEVRDALSSVVMSVKNLTPGLDYDIDYIQGRIMLKAPLSATAASEMLVNSEDFGGNRIYLVANYEYTPGFEDLEDIVTGGRAHYWFGDHVKLGMTLEDQEVTGSETSLNAYDLTLRKNAGTWLKLQQSTSQGPVSSTQYSSDGGYDFDESALAAGTNVKAKGQRVDASVRLEDIFASLNGKLTFYNQQLDAGYAAPGLIANTDTTQSGAMLEMPITDSVNVKLKANAQDQENALQTEALEVDVDYLLNNNWTFGLGWRKDTRTDDSAVVPLTQQQGDRSDVAVRATYDSDENWQAYGFAQDTASVTGNRDENGRIGVGAEYRASDRIKLDGELSSGDIGPAAKLGVNYKMTDATDIYSSYAFENERTDNGVKARRGNWATGFKSRYSDSASIYMEERYTHGDVPTGLTHALGFDLVVTDRLNLGGSIDIGSLRDENTGAETNRTAAGFRIGYKFNALTYAGALEYRVDETEQPDTSFAERTTWLMKNSIKYYLNQDWRLIGKLNYSESESSLGDFYNGDFTEAVLGYAYRPVNNDALNALFKYTYFYNLPTTDQLTPNNSSALYIQKSHVLSLDFSYDLTSSWTLGGKYAHRFGQLSLDRVNPNFFDSEAALYILRADWHFNHRWDALLEGRLLDVKEAGDARSGMLLGIYRHFGDNIKMGVGYNFTDFSDDLTDLDYDSQGMFVNVIGKF
jgi:uncharacterized repeat protein (TIGR01451 family)/fimbrial isopeptide formation D2 family protein